LLPEELITMSAIPHKIQNWIGKPVVTLAPVMTVEQGLWLNYCVAVEDGNPLYWSQPVEVAGMQPIAPPAMLPSWMIDHAWSPDPEHEPLRTLELHFMLKDELGLPFGVVTRVELEFHEPVRAGDRLRAEQVLLDVSGEYETRMGPGRRWSIAVHYYHQNDALAGVQTLHFVSYRKDDMP
tara:strand:+ start:955 stop:1494 length:540 start_codon:yes stop_codon:yes gene_type:complete